MRFSGYSDIIKPQQQTEQTFGRRRMDKKEFTESYQNLLEENKNLFNAYLADLKESANNQKPAVASPEVTA